MRLPLEIAQPLIGGGDANSAADYWRIKRQQRCVIENDWRLNVGAILRAPLAAMKAAGPDGIDSQHPSVRSSAHRFYHQRERMRERERERG